MARKRGDKDVNNGVGIHDRGPALSLGREHQIYHQDMIAGSRRLLDALWVRHSDILNALPGTW